MKPIITKDVLIYKLIFCQLFLRFCSSTYYRVLWPHLMKYYELYSASDPETEQGDPGGFKYIKIIFGRPVFNKLLPFEAATQSFFYGKNQQQRPTFS